VIRTTAIAALALLLIGAADAPIPPALSAMVETERAFAKRAAEVGVRDSFLEFFADDAIRFAEAPGPAKPFFRALGSQPPSHVELTWAPRFGDVAASGELGYLTGPATRLVHGDSPRPPASICYFSIWKKQPDGSFKVFIDQGISTPEPVTFPAGFTRAAAADRFTGSAGDGRATLERADRALMTNAAATPLADVYKRVLAGDGRVYRDGVMPMVGDAAVRWLASSADRRMTGESLNAEAARSGDLGYTYGRYTLTPSDPAGDPERGHYVRVWTRTRSGQWKLALEVTVPAPAPR
jgi:ketosteroid isomerase-like protein